MGYVDARRVVCLGEQYEQRLTFRWGAAACDELVEFSTRKLLEMGEEPKLTCAGDSQMKTTHFYVALGALNLKETSPLLKILGRLCIRDSCPPGCTDSQHILHKLQSVIAAVKLGLKMV